MKSKSRGMEEIEAEVIFTEIIAKTFPKLIKDSHTKIQETQQAYSKINTNTSWLITNC